MARRITVVVSQGQSASPPKRKLEEDLVAALLFEAGVEVTVIPNLYDLAPDGTGMLCLQGITGDMVIASWLFPRAAHWTLDRNGIRGRFGASLLASESGDDDSDDDGDATETDAAPTAETIARVDDSRPPPDRTIWCLDLRAFESMQPYLDEIRRIAREATIQTVEVGLSGWIQGSPKPQQLARYFDPSSSNGGANSVAPAFALVPPPEQGRGEVPGASLPLVNGESEGVSHAGPAPLEPTRITEHAARRWYPVIDYSRCTNCLECLDFCLFGVYGIGGAETILVEQPDNCRKGCPACSRVCPENAIIFPQHKTPAIAGSPDGTAGGLKIDLSKLFGAPDALDVAVLERDVELVAVGRDAVGATVGIPKRQSGRSSEKDDLDSLMDELDSLEL